MEEGWSLEVEEGCRLMTGKSCWLKNVVVIRSRDEGTEEQIWEDSGRLSVS